VSGTAGATAAATTASIENLRRIEFHRRLQDFLRLKGGGHTRDSEPPDTQGADCGI
jgi:hypothetical protein